MDSGDEKQATRPKRSVRRKPSDDYMDWAKAMKFIEKCDRDDVAVLGIEGFVRDSDGVRPQLDLIADSSPSRLSDDLTWEEYRPKANLGAREFLETARARANVVFDFVTWSKNDWLARGKRAAGKN